MFVSRQQANCCAACAKQSAVIFGTDGRRNRLKEWLAGTEQPAQSASRALLPHCDTRAIRYMLVPRQS